MWRMNCGGRESIGYGMNGNGFGGDLRIGREGKNERRRRRSKRESELDSQVGRDVQRIREAPSAQQHPRSQLVIDGPTKRKYKKKDKVSRKKPPRDAIWCTTRDDGGNEIRARET